VNKQGDTYDTAKCHAFYFAVGSGAMHCDEHVSGCASLCVCLSVYKHTSKTTRPIVTENSTKILFILISFAEKPLERICTKFGAIEGVVHGNNLCQLSWRSVSNGIRFCVGRILSFHIDKPSRR